MPNDTIAQSLAQLDNLTQQSNGVYQKRIQSPQLNLARADSSGLGQSLSILGETINKAVDAQDSRMKAVGVDQANKILSQATDEDIWRLKGIEMIGNKTSPDQHLQDNPYAVATIEKMRGSYIASQSHDSYMTWRAEQPPVKTATEELKRYSDYMEEKKKVSAQSAVDAEAFNNGFYQDFIKNQVAVASQQRTEQTLEWRAIQKGTTQAALGWLARSSDQFGDEDIQDRANQVFADARISWMPIKDRVEFAQSFLKDIATTSGNYNLISRMADNVTIGTGDDGKPVHIGDVLNVTDYKQVAYQRTDQIFGENIQKSVQSLQKMSIPEQNAYFRNLQATNPDWYNSMVAFQKPAYEYQIQLQKKRELAAAKLAASNSLNKQAEMALSMQVEAWMHNALHDGAGRPVASSKGSLPSLEIDTVDDNGNPIKKKMEWTDDVLNRMVDNQLQLIQGNQNLSDEEKSNQVLHLLQFPPFESYRNTVKNAFTSTLDNTTAARIETNDAGWANASPQLQSTLALYRSNPSVFRTVFGEEATTKAAAIQQLSEGSNGDYAQGIKMYALGRENAARDPEFVNNQNTQIKDALTYSSMSGFQDLSGNYIDADMSLGTNAGAMSVIEKQARMMAYANMSPLDAVNKAKENACKTYKVYDSTLVPEGFFGGINSENRLALGKQTLDDFKSKFVSDSGCDPAYIVTQYMPDSQTIVFSGGGQYKSYSANDVAYWGNNLLQQQPSSSNNADYDTVNQERTEKAQREQNGLYTPQSGDGLTIPFSK